METPNVSKSSWENFDKQLRAYVRSRVDPLWIDDIVGDILLRLVKNTKAFRAADNPTAYVHTVARNAVTDYYRRKAAEARALADVESDAKIGSERDPDESDAAQLAISQCMFSFIEDLPEKYKEALTLTEIEQLSQKHAAARLGLSLSGLKSRVQRGRTLLKRAVTCCCSVKLDHRGSIMDYEQRSDDCRKKC